MPRKIVIDPVTRVEGHGKITLLLDENDVVQQARLHVVEFRGFEKFIQGRPYWEVPVMVQRLCGICPVSHHLAAAKAMDVVAGAGTGAGLTPTAEKIRRLMHYGQIFQSHALHFFHLASPDLLFGYDSAPETRNVIGVALANRELALQAVLMRKFGQEVIAATAGKKIHGTGAIPGGVNQSLTAAERDRLLQGPAPLNAGHMVQWAQGALEFFKHYYQKNRAFIDGFSKFPSNHLSLVRADGALDLYHGVLRAVDAGGQRILDGVDYQEYLQHLREEVRPWSYMKFPFLKALGPEKGWYRVGPLARLNTADFIPTPLAQKEFEIFRAATNSKPNDMCLHTHWARLIEVLHAAERMRELLEDPDITGSRLVTKGPRQAEGVGVIEAPRGTLFHHYRVGDDDLIQMANLIVSTTHNNEPMNRAVNCVARRLLTGVKEITEGMLNAVEVAIRAYDPCLSCATHAYGQMPLEVALYDAAGILVSRRRK